MPLNPNVRLKGRYRIVAWLGGGGFSDVYLAVDESRANLKVAVKSMRDDTVNNDLIEDEAKLGLQLSHPNVVTVYELFAEGSETYVVMEYVDGRPLWQDAQQAISSGIPVKADSVLDWTTQACRGLAYLHENDIVHRDIKPHNILLRSDGVIKLIDLGISKKGEFTKTIQLKKAASPYFAPPEMYGPGSTFASDVYALGMVAYVLLGARLPPEANERVAKPPRLLVPLKSLNPSVPDALNAVIMKATEVNSTRRFGDAGAMLEALEALRSPALQAPSAAPRFCRACGIQLRAGAKHCTNCGQPVGNTRSAVMAVPGMPGPNALAAHASGYDFREAQVRFDRREYAACAAMIEAAYSYPNLMDAISPDEKFLLARCYVMLRQFTKVNSLASQTASTDGAQLIGTLARAKLYLGDLDPARLHAEESIRGKPRNAPDGRFTLGVLACYARKYAEAVQHLRECTRLDANDYDAWLWLGYAYSMTGDAVAAREAVVRASSLEPGMADPHIALAYLALGSRDWALAMQETAAAQQCNPSHPHLPLLRQGFGKT